MAKDFAISIPINGKSTRLGVARIPLSELKADEENPRIGLFRDHQPNKTLTELQIKKIEKQTKLSMAEINQNIKAFQLMQEQYLPLNQDPNEVSKFSYFVEYVKDNKLKKLMEKNGFDDKSFCDWVSDKNKIPTGQDVRRLRDI